MTRGWLAAMAMLVAAVASPAQTREARVYAFGNSLVHNLSDSHETSVPYWLGVLARADGQSLAMEGQWGFLRNFVADLPPRPNWDIKDVPGVGAARALKVDTLDALLIAPANFIQYQAPDRPYDGENPSKASPLGAALDLLNAVAPEGAAPGRVLLYQGWAEMPGLIVEDPGDAEDFARYYDRAQGDYLAWYEDWADALRAARPDLDLRLVPVAQQLARLLTSPPLNAIEPSALYVDDDPHGTPTLYFLAAAITYGAIFDRPLPVALDLPDSIHPLVRDNIALIAAELSGEEQRSDAAPQTRPETEIDPEPSEIADIAPGEGLANPSLAMGLNGLADWSSQHPFIDLIKTARPWIGHLPGRWGGWTGAEFEAGGYLDAEGWLTRMPEEVERVEMFVLTDQPPEAVSLSGDYLLRYEGSGTLSLSGRARRARAEPGVIRFSYQPGDGPVGIVIEATDPEGTGDHLRNFSLVREDHAELAEAGALFNPAWLAHISDLRALRFMDWMQTNGSLISSWDDRPRVSDYTYVRRGVPVEVMVALANRIGADAWFTMPHMADDDYIRNFALHVWGELDRDLKAYVEYSNELWNFVFPQAHWAVGQAQARWGDGMPEDGWLQYAALRAQEVMGIWGDVYGSEMADRLVRVIAVHTGWIWLEQSLLHAPLAVAERPELGAPVDSFDAYAVTGYFGHSFGTEDWPPRLLEWLEASRAEATARGQAEGLQRVALREFAKLHQFEQVVPRVAEALRKEDLDEYLTEILPHHAKVARQEGLQLVMYEGGTHVVGLEQWVENQDLTDLFIALNYSAEMGAIYDDLLAAWKDAGGTLFNAFVDVAAPSRFGSWGSLRHLDDENPRYAALMRFNRAQAGWWETRAPETFLHGVIQRGGDGADRLEGTGRRDVLLAGAGDDILIAAGHGDLLHGGSGQDVAILPGRRVEYMFEADGAAWRAIGPDRVYRLTRIERIEFLEEPGTGLSTADLP